MGIDTPVDSGGGGGATQVNLSDVSGTNSGPVETIVAPDGSASISGTTGYIRPLPNNGARYTGTLLSGVELTMALDMNEAGAPIRDKSALDGYLTNLGGAPDFQLDGHLGADAIKLGRSTYGLLSTVSNAYLAPTSTTSGGHTISFWGKIESAGAGDVGFLVSFYNSPTDRLFLFCDTTSIRFSEDSTALLAANVLYTTLTGLPTPIDLFDGEFHLFTCTREHDGVNRTLNFYIDGQLVATNSDTNPMGLFGKDSTVFNISGEDNATASGAICTYDEFVISSSVWTPDMVIEAYNAGAGVSFTQTLATVHGFTRSYIGNYNQNINHIWLMDETSGVTASDSVGFAHLTGEGSVTRNVAGRWPSTIASRVNPVNGARFVRRDSFDGPNQDTPFALSMDVKFNADPVGATTSLFATLVEIGVEAAMGGSTRFALDFVGTPTLRIYNGSSNLPTESVSSIIADGNWHTVTWGQRFSEANLKEIFLAVDGDIYILENVTWNSLSGPTVDFAIGESLTWGSGGTSNIRYADFDVQNVVMWKNVSLTNEAIEDLNGAQLVEIVS